MRVVIFCHSIVSDWNHGNAHFLRGVASELIARAHEVDLYEPAGGWSLSNLREQHGEKPIADFFARYPWLRTHFYEMRDLDLDRVLDRADLVLVHEWNSPELVRALGDHRSRSGGYRLLFHDTHHRSVTDPAAMGQYDLTHYDGVLAFGEAIRQIYLERGWARRVWTWHEAADIRIFRPERAAKLGDLVWIGNWGDDERSAELRELLIEPVRQLGLRASVYGVRYPPDAIAELRAAGIRYEGWLPNFRVPETFARFRVTIHVPRRPYVRALPGIPTIRPFEALACGIPLITAPWTDCEGLFSAGTDYLIAEDGRQMCQLITALLASPYRAQRLAANGWQTIRRRHTCAHRVDELLRIHGELEKQEDSRNGDRLLRVEPGVGLLERGGHLL